MTSYIPLSEAISVAAEFAAPGSEGHGQFVGMEHLEPGSGRRIGSAEIELASTSGSKQRFREGDIVYGRLRPYLNKVWLAEFGGFCSVDQTVFRVNDAFDPSFVASFMRSEAFLSQIVPLIRGELPRVRNHEVLAARMPSLAFSEQRRIASELREQFAAVEATRTIAAIRRQLAGQVRDATFRSAFEGRRALRWPRTRLGKICEFISDGTHQPPQFTADGVPFLFVRNIVAGRIDLDTSEHVSAETYEELTRRRRAVRGDVLYSAVGSFGVAVVVETDRPFTFQRHIAHLRVRQDVASPDFVAAYLNSPRGRRQSESLAVGGAQRTVTLGALASFDVPVPPPHEQGEIANELRQRLAVIDGMETSIRAEREAIDALTAALLRRAFDGPAT